MAFVTERQLRGMRCSNQARHHRHHRNPGRERQDQLREDGHDKGRQQSLHGARRQRQVVEESYVLAV